MKKLLLILLFVCSCSFAQSSYIVDKKGNKSLVRDELTQVILENILCECWKELGKVY